MFACLQEITCTTGFSRYLSSVPLFRYKLVKERKTGMTWNLNFNRLWFARFLLHRLASSLSHQFVNKLFTNDSWNLPFTESLLDLFYAFTTRNLLTLASKRIWRSPTMLSCRQTGKHCLTSAQTSNYSPPYAFRQRILKLFLRINACLEHCKHMMAYIVFGRLTAQPRISVRLE